MRNSRVRFALVIGLVGLLLIGWVAWRSTGRVPVFRAPKTDADETPPVVSGDVVPPGAGRAKKPALLLRLEEEQPDAQDRADEAPGDKPQVSLLLIEYQVTPAGDRPGLVRYRFRRGDLLGKDIVFVDDRPRRLLTVFRPRPLVRDRYVITWRAEVIDAASGRMLNEEPRHARCLGLDGDKVVIHLADEHGDAGFKTFDLSTLREETLREPGRWALPGVRSPGKDMSVEGYHTGQVYLHRLDGSQALLGAGFLAEVSWASSAMPGAPLLWLDNSLILTQTSNSHLVTVTTDGHVVPLLDLPVGPPDHGPRLYRDRDGTILYADGTATYAIDVKGRKFSPYQWMPLGHGFDCEYDENREYGRIIRYRGREIGRLWCEPWDAVTAGGHLAMPYRPDGSSPTRSQGVQVWDAATGKWVATYLGVRYQAIAGWTD